jgi:hypothetical protein
MRDREGETITRECGYEIYSPLLLVISWTHRQVAELRCAQPSSEQRSTVLLESTQSDQCMGISFVKK